jgi:hypothetical protein
VITQLRSHDHVFISLGKRTVIDLHNSQEINDYIELLENKYNYLDNWYKSLEIIEIIFNYTKISDYDYNRNKDSILSKLKNSINLKEEKMISNKIHNLPLDFNYKAWGDHTQIMNSTTYRVFNDCIIITRIYDMVT